MKSNVTKKEIDFLLHYSEALMLIGHSIKNVILQTWHLYKNNVGCTNSQMCRVLCVTKKMCSSKTRSHEEIKNLTSPCWLNLNQFGSMSSDGNETMPLIL
jgi:hypothetical protein